MRKALFIAYLVWVIAVVLVFAPMVLALTGIAGMFGLCAAVTAKAMQFLTLGVFD